MTADRFGAGLHDVVGGVEFAQPVAEDEQEALPDLVAAKDLRRPGPFHRVPGARRDLFEQRRVPRRPIPRRLASVMGTWNEALRTGFGLVIGADGTLELRFGTILLSSGVALLTREWLCVGASYDAATGAVTLWQHLLAGPHDDRGVLGHPPGGTRRRGFIPGDTPFLFAAWQAGPATGWRRPPWWRALQRQDRPPAPRRRALTRRACRRCMAARSPGLRPRGRHWDFTRDIRPNIRDTSPNRLDGTIVNQPTRAMTGHNWDGADTDWRAGAGAIRRHPFP